MKFISKSIPALAVSMLILGSGAASAANQSSVTTPHVAVPITHPPIFHLPVAPIAVRPAPVVAAH